MDGRLPALVLRQSEADKVRNAEISLTEQGKQITPDGIVAELPLGFWNALLNVYYERRLVHLIIRAVFPNMPRATRTRGVVSKRMNTIRGLRNRVFHHEPVWYWGNLAALHHEVTEACHWMSVELGDILKRMDRFGSVLAAGPAPFLKVL